ncbi:hypothetical protein K439DRAFT_1414172 [Ramaria rubella]|nr:hypothetical protein K439DRAFT_1414172 [Ramaria rubella]
MHITHSIFASLPLISCSIAIKASSFIFSQNLPYTTVVLQSDTILCRAVPSFQVSKSPMSPANGTVASRAHEKQPANPTPDSTVSPSQGMVMPNMSPQPPFSLPCTPDQRLDSLEQSVGALIALMHQAKQQLQPQQQPQPQQQLPRSPQQLLPQQQSMHISHQAMQPQFNQHALSPAPPQFVPSPINVPTFMPPISLNPASGMSSLNRSFPQINAALRLAIMRHEFCPGHLFKLDSTIKDKPKAKTFEISDSGDLTQHDRDTSLKDYPSFCSLFDPLSIYFEILQLFIITSGNISAIQQVVLGCSEYLRILYYLYTCYEWTSVLQYHFTFHSRCLAEMCDGDYSGWKIMDTKLASLHLYRNIKQSNYKSPSSPINSSPNAKQTCFSFQNGKCPSPCTHRCIHKCKVCQSTDHGRLSCTKKIDTSS